MAIVVSGLAITPVKGTRLRPVDRLTLEPTGVRENRRFYLVDARDRMVNAKRLGELQAAPHLSGRTSARRCGPARRGDRDQLLLSDARGAAGPGRVV